MRTIPRAITGGPSATSAAFISSDDPSPIPPMVALEMLSKSARRESPAADVINRGGNSGGAKREQEDRAREGGHQDLLDVARRHDPLETSDRTVVASRRAYR